MFIRRIINLVRRIPCAFGHHRYAAWYQEEIYSHGPRTRKGYRRVYAITCVRPGCTHIARVRARDMDAWSDKHQQHYN